jgi:serine/threonine protein phosphatase PrpC
LIGVASSGRHLLFIAHLGDSAVIVFDTRAQQPACATTTAQ